MSRKVESKGSNKILKFISKARVRILRSKNRPRDVPRIFLELEDTVEREREELRQTVEFQENKIQSLTEEGYTTSYILSRIRAAREIEWDAVELNLERYPEALEELRKMRYHLNLLIKEDKGDRLIKQNSPAALALLIRTLPQDKETSRLL